MNGGPLSSFHRILTASVLMCLVSVTWSPVALAETAWKEDGWYMVLTRLPTLQMFKF